MKAAAVTWRTRRPDRWEDTGGGTSAANGLFTRVRTERASGITLAADSAKSSHLLRRKRRAGKILLRGSMRTSVNAYL